MLNGALPYVSTTYVLRTRTDIQPTLMRGCVLKVGTTSAGIAAVQTQSSGCPAPRSVGTSERAEGGSGYEVRQSYEVLQ